jgi:hypothetical protein
VTVSAVQGGCNPKFDHAFSFAVAWLSRQFRHDAANNKRRAHAFAGVGPGAYLNNLLPYAKHADEAPGRGSGRLAEFLEPDRRLDVVAQDRLTGIDIAAQHGGQN